MTSVRCENDRKCVITLGVKMWTFLMFGFVAQNKYSFTALGEQAPVSTPQQFTLFTGLGIPVRTRYM